MVLYITILRELWKNLGISYPQPVENVDKPVENVKNCVANTLNTATLNTAIQVSSSPVMVCRFGPGLRRTRTLLLRMS